MIDMIDQFTAVSFHHPHQGQTWLFRSKFKGRHHHHQVDFFFQVYMSVMFLGPTFLLLTCGPPFVMAQ